MTVVDEARDGRELTVDVWYPAEPGPEPQPAEYSLLGLSLASPTALKAPPAGARLGGFPLIVFSHGNGGIRFQSFFLTELLASHGFVVAAPDHTGNTLLALIEADGEQSMQDVFDATLARPPDVSAVIDAMLELDRRPNGRFTGRIDGSSIGVTGHSLGGLTALTMAAGYAGSLASAPEVSLPEGFEPISPDPRVDAIAPIAPATDFLGNEELARIHTPALVVGGTLDRTTPIVPDSQRAFGRTRGAPRVRVDVIDAGHFSFTNVCTMIDVAEEAGFDLDLVDALFGGPLNEGCGPDFLPVGEVHRLTSLFVTAFFKRELTPTGSTAFDRFLTRGYAREREPAAVLMRASGAGALETHPSQ